MQNAIWSALSNYLKATPLENSVWLTRSVVLKATAFIYFVAFAVSYNQNIGLIGKDSLMPFEDFLENYSKTIPNPTPFEKFKSLPTLFWFFGTDDYYLNLVSLLGIFFSLITLFGIVTHSSIFLILWLLYHSIVDVGQRWFSFGWESQLLETGFLCIFLAPTTSISCFSKNSPPSKLILWLFLWLEFRIMLGAGMIKIRGDACWKDLTCMNYHYETQPNPLPTAFYMHQTPEFVHKFEVLGNHAIELGFGWLIIMPNRMCKLVGGFFLVLFQVVLISSGNLSFLNWLTIVPTLAAFDDNIYKHFHTRWTVEKAQYLTNPIIKEVDSIWRSFWKIFNFIISCAFVAGILYLSKPVMENIISSKQIMNTSFDNFRLVNTYGAFGSVGQKRYEVILEVTFKDTPEKDSDWNELIFKCKPGPINRRPCIITPYHYRLDWVIWFAGFEPHDYRYHPWILHLMAKLLVGHQNTLDLMDPINYDLYYPNGRDQKIRVPTYIRANIYEYKFTPISKKLGSKDWEIGNWWVRRKKGNYVPMLNLENEGLREAMRQMGWKMPHTTKEKGKKNKGKSEL